MLSNEIRSSRSWQRGHAALVGFVVILLVAIAATGAVVWRHRDTSHKATTTASTASSANPMTAALPSGTDNASLQADLANLSSANAQDSQNISSANVAVNDQQNEITVPAN